jgi:protein-disulfide isomerase
VAVEFRPLDDAGSLAGRVTSDLTSAPVPPLRGDDHVRGPEGAPLLIVYADFTCQRCALTALRVEQRGLRVCFRHFARGSRHPRALPAALAAEAAARQGAFWPFHDALYADQGRLDDPHLWARCERLGLDLGRFDADRRDERLAARVARDVREAMRGGAATTPFVILPDGSPHQGVPEAGQLERLAG